MYYGKTMGNNFSEFLLQRSKLIQYTLKWDLLLDHNLRVLVKLLLSVPLYVALLGWGKAVTMVLLVEMHSYICNLITFEVIFLLNLNPHKFITILCTYTVCYGGREGLAA